MYPVECIKKCGMTIVRSKEAYHLLNDCPLQFIRCINSDRGCSAQLVRKDLSEHLKVFFYRIFQEFSHFF